MSISGKGITVYKAAKQLVAEARREGDEIGMGEAIRIFEAVSIHDLTLVNRGIKSSLDNIHTILLNDCSLNAVKGQIHNIDITLSETLGSYKTGVALDAITEIAEMMKKGEEGDPEL